MATQDPVKNYIPSFVSKLKHIIPATISTNQYCVIYLEHLLNHQAYYLAIYADVLDKLMLHANLPKESIRLIDTGAGNGLLGIFAKYCGFKNVWINDLDINFIKASQQLSQQLEISIDGFITGDMDAAKAFFKDEKPNAVVGTDMIEHVYDLDDFFQNMMSINPAIVSVFTTAANPQNIVKVKRLKRLQVKDEFEGGAPEDFSLFGSEAHASFISIRKEIIKSVGQTLDDNIVQLLATNTRGMRKQDIIKATIQYVQQGIMPVPPAHPTNTCNPVTGSWTERILSLDTYKSLYSNHELRLTVHDGFYNNYKPGIKGYLNVLLNKIICILGSRLAPYVLLVGSKK